MREALERVLLAAALVLLVQAVLQAAPLVAELVAMVKARRAAAKAQEALRRLGTDTPKKPTSRMSTTRPGKDRRTS